MEGKDRFFTWVEHRPKWNVRHHGAGDGRDGGSRTSAKPPEPKGDYLPSNLKVQCQDQKTPHPITRTGNYWGRFK